MGALAWPVLAGVWLAAASGTGAQESPTRLQQILEEIEVREARAREFTERADTLLARLEAVEREMIEARKSGRRLSGRERAALGELEQARADVDEAQRQSDVLEERLGPRLVALYKFSATGGLPALYAEQRDFQSALRLREGLSRVLSADAQLFARYRRLRSEAEERSREARRLVEEIALTREEVKQRRALERQKRVERDNVAGLLKARAGREQALADELRAAAVQLERELGDLAAAEPVSEGAALVQGELPRPVRGKIRAGFGIQRDPEYQTRIRSDGIEISADRGTDVRAVAAGRVVYAGWFRGYGQVVILDHGAENLTVSGYLDELAVQADDVVRQGELVGRVGDTGSLSGTGLYFELRQGGVAVDPRPWFQPETEGRS